MRLLEYNDSGGFSLTKNFGDNDIPRYAILSHTWGADNDEVTFGELMEGTGTSKVGYEKIRFCGEQAKRDGIRYFWVDTCCIDKTNDNELSEAINSMFRWYRDAAKCYVILSDVSRPAPDADEEPHQPSWEPAFRRSRWFTRGWTLQDLLAPSSVEFFSCEGKRLGDKRSLERQVHEITGIAVSALRGAPLSQFSIDERLSWAKNRQTTREEDSAYALLGIFDVYMPLLYGEGKENAFNRLLEEVNKPLKGLDHLPFAVDAPFDSYNRQYAPSCLPDTRVDLLQKIYNWADKQDERCIFWLNGLVGTGKSTIACTVAHEYSQKKRLGASIFFSRGGGDVSHAGKFFTSIAVQLANNIPSLRQFVSAAITEQNNIMNQSLREQWRQLVLLPLSRLHGTSSPTSYLLVVDALDECDSEDDIQTILQLFIEARTLKTVRLRVFLTSRPEIPIRHGFFLIPETEHEDFVLHNIASSIINHDVSIFLQHNLEVIRQEQSLEAGWPGEQAIQSLVQDAGGLFVWAATACRFVREGKRLAAKRLDMILKSSGTAITAPEEQLHKIYMTVLEHSIHPMYTTEEAEDLRLQLKCLLGNIVALFSPLSIQALSKLVNISEEVVDQTLDDLHAILDIPKDPKLPVRLHHPSFRDFLFKKDSHEGPDIWVDELQAHQTLADCCIRLLSNSLKQDICNLSAPDTLVADTPSGRIAQCLPPEVKYACLYWIQHLTKSNSQLCDNDQVHQFLQVHLLHWLEALGWMGKASEGILTILSLETQIQADRNPNFYALVHDAKRFALYNRSVIKQAPLQLYHSALFFAPEKSIVRRRFEKSILPWVQTKPKIEAIWSAALQPLEGHSGSVRSVTFSPDGQQVASGSDDSTIQLWDIVTGVIVQTLEGHSGSVYSVAFSPDGKQLASGSGDKTIRLWDAVTGALLQTLEGHSDYVNSVAFSQDSKQVASGSYDSTVRLWDGVTGVALQTLEGHSNSVSSVAFSPDGKQVVSGSYDSTVRLWDLVTGAPLQTLEGHVGYVNSVAFSPDIKQVVSGSEDKSVRLWNTVTGASLQMLRGHSSSVWSVAFSPDGRQIISGSDDETVRLWNAVTGVLLQTLKGSSSSVFSVAFSPDGKQVASGSYDSTVRLWDAVMGTPSQMSTKSTWVGMRSSNEENASEVSGAHSDSSSEAESVLSVAASASSRSSITGEVEILAGKEFAEILLDDKDLRSMFVSAIENDKIGTEKFERNIRRLLNQFSVGLKQEARIKEQNDAVYLIRSQSRFVARYVCNRVAPSKYPNRFDRLQKQSNDKPSRLLAQEAVNHYLEHSNDSHEEDVQGRPRMEEESESDSDIDEEFENYELLAGLSRVQDFMISSIAFSRFRENLRGFVRQDFMSKVNSLIRKLTKDERSYSRLEHSISKLNRLARELSSIPPNEIWLLFEETLCLSNRCKRIIEDLTHQTWEWWPLKPCRRPLSAGHARLFWNCACGEVRWEDVPLPFAIRFSKLLKQARNSLSTQASSNLPHFDWTTQAENSGIGMQLSSLDRQSLDLVQNEHEHISHNNPRLNMAASTEIATRTTPALQSLPTTYVLLGVTVGDDLRLAQIEVQDISHARDDHFFKELRRQYNGLRGLVRRWFGIYKYAHCHFVKFEKIGDNEIVPRDEDSIPDPEDLTYQYTPKPIEHMPPITEHEFRRRFYACYNRCSMSKIIFLSAFHRCNRVCRQSQVLSRIPKKTWRLEANGDSREIFWGILAIEEISFLVVSIYHFLILVPGFIFWFLWLFFWDHGGDLQNASVPFLALLACLPLFWFPLIIKTK